MIDEIIEIGNIYKTPSQPRGGFESTLLTEYVGLAEMLKEKKLKSGFIEIGSAWGASFHLIASYVDGIKISIDIPYTDNTGFEPWPPGLTLDILENRLITWKTHFDNVHQIIGNSRDVSTITALENLLTSPVSFLYIDAEHTKDMVKLDFLNYKRFVEPGGFIAFHDIQMTHPHCMDEFWNEVKVEYPNFELGTTLERIGVIQL